MNTLKTLLLILALGVAGHAGAVTATSTITPTWSASPTSTISPTFTFTRTVTLTATPTPTYTRTQTYTRTPTPSWTASQTFSVSPTFTMTPTYTRTPTSTVTMTFNATELTTPVYESLHQHVNIVDQKTPLVVTMGSGDSDLQKDLTGTARRSENLLKHLTGTADTELGVAKQLTGIAATLATEGTAKQLTGIAATLATEGTAKQLTGLAQTQLNMDYDLTGTARRLEALAQDLSGTARRLEGLLADVSGTARRLEALSSSAQTFSTSPGGTALGSPTNAVYVQTTGTVLVYNAAALGRASGDVILASTGRLTMTAIMTDAWTNFSLVIQHQSSGAVLTVALHPRDYSNADYYTASNIYDTLCGWSTRSSSTGTSFVWWNTINSNGGCLGDNTNSAALTNATTGGPANKGAYPMMMISIANTSATNLTLTGKAVELILSR